MAIKFNRSSDDESGSRLAALRETAAVLNGNVLLNYSHVKGMGSVCRKCRME